MRVRQAKPLPSAHVPIHQTDRIDVLGTIREVFTAQGACGRIPAIRRIATALGCRRLGLKTVQILSNDLKTAVRRGILEYSNGEYSLLCRDIRDYTVGHLVTMLVAAMGNGWQTRGEAIVAAARYMGYRRTGPKITIAFKSAINAALRRGLIERQGADLIRRVR